MTSQPQGDARSLYHRWRSRNFSEVVAQEHVTRTLKNAVAGGRIVHAYLFCGPRGTGKTSTARILAKAVNCLDPRAGEPCNRCTSCRAVNEGRAIDLIEIDAASNRGIDDARELREKIKFSPAESRYKVYIIDEAHMLTSEASNALLKTLEEPPPHAILILATTESHKILPTIASRCQRFDFRRIPLQAIILQLEMICQREGVTVETGVLDRVARMAKGSLRDAESLLDQLVAYCGESIDLPSAREVLGLTGEETVPEFAEALRTGDLALGFRLIDASAATGADLRHFARELVDYLRALAIARSGADTTLTAEFRADELAALRSRAERWEYGLLLSAIRSFIDLEGRMRMEPFNQVHLEIALMEVALAGGRPETPAGSMETAGRAAVPGLAPSSTPSSGGPPGGRDQVAVPAAGPLADGGEVSARAAGWAPAQLAASTSTNPPEGASSPSHREGEMQGAVSRGERTVREEASADDGDTEPQGGVERRETESGGVVANPKLDLANLRAHWRRILEELGAAGTAYMACHPYAVSGNEVIFSVERESLRNTLERPRLLATVEERIGRLFGVRVAVKFRYGVKISREVEQSGRDAVVDTAVRELGFKILRTERKG